MVFQLLTPKESWTKIGTDNFDKEQNFNKYKRSQVTLTLTHGVKGCCST